MSKKTQNTKESSKFTDYVDSIDTFFEMTAENELH
jgi:hypothetical protein